MDYCGSSEQVKSLVEESGIEALEKYFDYVNRKVTVLTALKYQFQYEVLESTDFKT